MSTFLRRLLLAFGSLAVVGLLFFALAHLPAVRVRVLSWAAGRLAAASGLRLTADRLDYNLATLSATARGVTLAAPDRPDDPVLRAETIRAQVPWSALSGVLSLSSLEIDRPQILIVRDQQGRFNLPDRGANGGGGLGRLPVDRLVIRDLSFRYDDRGRDMAVDVARLSLQMDPDGPGRIAGPLSPGGTLAVRIGAADTTTNLAGRIGYDGEAVDLAGLSLSGPEGVMTLDGRIPSVLGSPVLELVYKTDIDINRAAAWSPIADRPTGRLLASGRIDGPASALRVTADVTATAVEWLGVTNMDVRASVDLSADALTLTRADVKLAAGELTGSGRIPLAAGGPMEARLGWRNFDAEQLVPLLPEGAPRLAATLEGMVEFQWAGDDRGEVRIDVVNRSTPRAASPGELPLAGDAEVLVEHGRWRATLDHQVASAARVTGTVAGAVGDTWSDSTIGGDVAVTTDDLARLARALVRARLSPATAVEGLEGALDLNARVSGRLNSLDAQGTLAGSDVVLRGFGPAEVDGRFLVNDRRLEVRGLEAYAGTNRATVDATYTFGSGAILGRAAGSFDRLDDFTSGLPAAWRPAGALVFDAAIGGTAARPRLEGRFSGRDIEVAAQRIVSAEGAVRFEDERITVDMLDVVQPGAGRLGGSVGYDLQTGALDVLLDGRRLAIGSLPAGAVTDEPLDLSTVVDVELEVRGTRARPTGSGRLAFSSLSVGGTDLGAPIVGLSFRDGAAWIDGGLDQIALAANGRVSLLAPYESEITARLTDSSLERLAALVPGPDSRVTGTTSLSVTARGPLASWRDMDLEGTISALDARIGERSIVLLQPGRFRYLDDEITAENLEVGSGNARIGLSGTLSRRDATGRLSATIAGPLEDLVAFLQLAGAPENLSARGVVDAKVDLSGALNRPVVSGTISLENGDLLWSSFSASGVTARGALEGGVLRVDTLSGYWQGASFKGSGVVPLTILGEWLPDDFAATLPASPREAAIALRVENLTAAAMSPWLPPEMATELDGRMTLTIDARADRLELAAVTGTMIVEDAVLSFSRVPVVQELPTRVTFANGEVVVDAARLSGGGTVLVASGKASLAGETPEIEVQADGSVDLRLFTAFSTNTATGGTAEVSLTARGPWNEPRVTGRFDLQNAELRLRDPRVAVSELNGVVTLAENRLAVDGIRGTVNGGDIELRGELAYKGLTIVGGRVDIDARDVGVEYPEGLRSLFDSALVLTVADDGQPVLSGKVTVERGAYRRRLSLTRELLSSGGSTIIDPGAEPSIFGSMRLNIAVVTAEDVILENNYGRLELGADLRLSGTVDQPALGGRATLREGGEIYLGGNTYLIERGTIDFLNPSAIEPTLDVSARTRVSGYEITMNVSGTPGAIQTDLVSDPPLGQNDVVSVLLTGRTLDQAGSAQSDVAQEQLLGLLSGEFLSAAGEAVGLDRVRFEREVADDTSRVDPGYVASEEDPSARLTIAKNLRRDVEVIVSRNLRTGDLTWITSYQPRRGVDIRAITRDNNDRSYEFSQDLSFGGPPRAVRVGRPEERRRVSTIRFSGEPGFPEDVLLDRLRLGTGDRFDFYRWQDDHDRLHEFYWDRGFYEARVTARRSTEDLPADQIRLEYALVRGPATRLVVEGADLPGSVEDDIRDAWTRSVFDEFLLEDIRTLTRRWLVHEGYVQGTVDVGVEQPGPDEKVIAVRVDEGPRASDREIAFAGNTSIDGGEIRHYVGGRQLEDEAWINPELLRQAVGDLYRSRGWLAVDARVGDPQYEGSRATIPVTIDEGPRFTVASVQLSGVSAEREQAVRTALAVQVAEPYDPARVDAGRAAVGAVYRREGFGRVATSATVAVDREKGTVGLTLGVREGVRQVLASVSILGANQTNRSFLTKALNLNVETPVDQSEWYAARKRMYDTGVFRRVDIEAVPLESASSIGGGVVVEERVEARVTVEEVATTRFRYGLQVNEEYAPASDTREVGPGFTANLERFNLFGRAMKAGLAFRYDRTNRIGRTYFIAPRFFGKPLTSSLFVSRSRELFGDERFDPFVTDRWEVTAEQRFRPRRRLEVAYSYQFERNRTFNPTPNPSDPFPLDIRVIVARLTSTTTFDSRDDAFDATRGWFHSSSVEYGPKALGSDIRFVKYLAQQYYYRPLTAGLVFASAVRVGVADGLGQELIPSERFYSGGGNSVRGYREDSLGGFDMFGDPVGGDALLELSEELRFPVYRWVRGVGFVDAGNVFPSASEISFADLKAGVGLGLRLDTPIALIRLDYGIPLSADQNGEKKGRWFLSIGQAF